MEFEININIKGKYINFMKITLYIVVIFFLILYWILNPYPTFYISKEISGYVLDKDDGKAIEGANVVVYWLLTGGMDGAGHGQNMGTFKVLETATDRNGRYYFSAWGPERINNISSLDSGSISSSNPKIIIFKNGYAPQVLRNSPTHGFLSSLLESNMFVKSSEWSGKTIYLNKIIINENLNEYYKLIKILESELKVIIGNKNSYCHGKSFKNMIFSVSSELHETFKKESSFDYYLKSFEQKCGE